MITVMHGTSTIVGNFILVTASFLILIGLIRAFAWKNITGIFEQRAQKIASDIDAAEQSNVQAQALVEKREQELIDSRMEGKQIVQDAVERAKVEKKHLLNQADLEIQGLKTKAQLEIEADKREAQESLRTQVAHMAVDLAGKIILEDLDEAAHSALVDRYIDRLGDK